MQNRAIGPETAGHVNVLWEQKWSEQRSWARSLIRDKLQTIAGVQRWLYAQLCGLLSDVTDADDAVPGASTHTTIGQNCSRGTAWHRGVLPVPSFL